MAIANLKAIADNLKTLLAADVSLSGVRWLRREFDVANPPPLSTGAGSLYPVGSVLALRKRVEPVYIPITVQTFVTVAIGLATKDLEISRDVEVAERQRDDLMKEVERVVLQNQTVSGTVFYISPGYDLEEDSAPELAVAWAEMTVQYETRDDP